MARFTVSRTYTMEKSEVREIAERIVRMFAQRVTMSGVRTRVTLSAGVASTEDLSVQSGGELMAAADAVLYKSKHAGKNIVMQARR